MLTRAEGLTPDEIDTFLKWVDDGAPQAQLSALRSNFRTARDALGDKVSTPSTID